MLSDSVRVAVEGFVIGVSPPFALVPRSLVSLVPKLCLGTPGLEALLRVNASGEMVLLQSRRCGEAELRGLSFPSRAWERGLNEVSKRSERGLIWRTYLKISASATSRSSVKTCRPPSVLCFTAPPLASDTFAVGNLIDTVTVSPFTGPALQLTSGMTTPDFASITVLSTSGSEQRTGRSMPSAGAATKAAARRSNFVGIKWAIVTSVEPRSTGRSGIAGLKYDKPGRKPQ